MQWNSQVTMPTNIGVGYEEAGGHVPPKFGKNFFRQLLCKIPALFWQKIM